MLGSVGEEGEEAGAANGHSQPTLVFGAAPCATASEDLAAIGEVLHQHLWSFVVDEVDSIHTERANLASCQGAGLLLAALSAGWT